MTYNEQICPGNFLLYDVFRNKMQGHLASQLFKLNPKMRNELMRNINGEVVIEQFNTNQLGVKVVVQGGGGVVY
jgi:hypothetical protein